MFWKPSTVRQSNNISIFTRLICWAAVVLNDRSTPFCNVLSKKDSATSNSRENVLVFYSIYFGFLCIIHNKRKETQLLQQISMILCPLSSAIFFSTESLLEENRWNCERRRVMEICCKSCFSFPLLRMIQKKPR